MSTAAGTGALRGAMPLRSFVWAAQLRRAWAWLRQQGAWSALQPRARRLQVQETVQLGERRFVSILRVDGEQFLIAGSSSGVVLLAAMQPDPQTPSFEAVLANEKGPACV